MVQISYFTVAISDSLSASKTRELSIGIEDTLYCEDVLKSYVPEDFTLLQNHPNPFNANTVIKYGLLKDCRVTLEVYNILGQRVATLFDEKQEAGYKTARWDAGSLSSGIYFYRLQAGGFVQTRRMVLLK